MSVIPYYEEIAREWRKLPDVLQRQFDSARTSWYGVFVQQHLAAIGGIYALLGLLLLLKPSYRNAGCFVSLAAVAPSAALMLLSPDPGNIGLPTTLAAAVAGFACWALLLKVIRHPIADETRRLLAGGRVGNAAPSL